jgi:hypothetical protein
MMGSATQVTWLGMTTLVATGLRDPPPDEVPPGIRGHHTAAGSRRHRGASDHRRPPTHPRTCESRGDHGVPWAGTPSTKIDHSGSAACSGPMASLNAPISALRSSSSAPNAASVTRSSSAVCSHRQGSRSTRSTMSCPQVSMTSTSQNASRVCPCRGTAGSGRSSSNLAAAPSRTVCSARRVAWGVEGDGASGAPWAAGACSDRTKLNGAWPVPRSPAEPPPALATVEPHVHQCEEMGSTRVRGDRPRHLEFKTASSPCRLRGPCIASTPVHGVWGQLCEAAALERVLPSGTPCARPFSTPHASHCWPTVVSPP